MEEELFIAGRFFHVGRINVPQLFGLAQGIASFLRSLSLMRAMATLLGNSTEVEMGKIERYVLDYFPWKIHGLGSPLFYSQLGL